MHTILAQLEAAVPGGVMTVVVGYGPLGVFCWWLTKLVESTRKELQKRDAMLMEINDKNVASLKLIAHRMSSLSRALVYNAATYGEGKIKALAKQEMEQWDKQENAE